MKSRYFDRKLENMPERLIKHGLCTEPLPRRRDIQDLQPLAAESAGDRL